MKAMATTAAVAMIVVLLGGVMLGDARAGDAAARAKLYAEQLACAVGTGGCARVRAVGLTRAAPELWRFQRFPGGSCYYVDVATFKLGRSSSGWGHIRCGQDYRGDARTTRAKIYAAHLACALGTGGCSGVRVARLARLSRNLRRFQRFPLGNCFYIDLARFGLRSNRLIGWGQIKCP